MEDQNQNNQVPTEPVLPQAPPEAGAVIQPGVSGRETVGVSVSPMPKPKGAYTPAQGIFMAIFGLVFVIAGLVAHSMSSVPSSYVHATGTITHVVVGPVNQENHTQATDTPTVHFKASNGKTYGFQSETSGSTVHSYIVGQQVPVAYNPKNPGSNPKLADLTASNITWFSYVIAGVGAFMIFAGVWMFARALSSQRKAL